MTQEEIKELWKEAARIAVDEGFTDEALDFAGWVIERELAGTRHGEEIMDMLRRYRFEKRGEARERLELRVRVAKLCGTSTPAALEDISPMLIRRRKLLQLASEGSGIAGIAKTFGISPLTVQKALTAAQDDFGEFLSIRP